MGLNVGRMAMASTSPVRGSSTTAIAALALRAAPGGVDLPLGEVLDRAVDREHDALARRRRLEHARRRCTSRPSASRPTTALPGVPASVVVQRALDALQPALRALEADHVGGQLAVGIEAQRLGQEAEPGLAQRPDLRRRRRAAGGAAATRRACGARERGVQLRARASPSSGARRAATRTGSPTRAAGRRATRPGSRSPAAAPWRSTMGPRWAVQRRPCASTGARPARRDRRAGRPAASRADRRGRRRPSGEDAGEDEDARPEARHVAALGHASRAGARHRIGVPGRRRRPRRRGCDGRRPGRCRRHELARQPDLLRGRAPPGRAGARAASMRAGDAQRGHLDLELPDRRPPTCARARACRRSSW